MPIYELKCKNCTHTFEVMGRHDQEFSCEECSTTLTTKDQVLHAVMFDLKGPGGFYSVGKSIPGCNAKPKEPKIGDDD